MKWIIFLLPIMLTVIYIISKSINKKIDVKNMVESIVNGLLITAMYNLILFLIVFMYTAVTMKSYEGIPKTHDNKLVTMKFQNGIQGDFFLGTGSISDKDYIVYTTLDGDEVKRNKISDNYKIIITDSEPRAEVTETTNYIKANKIAQFLYNIREEIEGDTTRQITLYIPKDSIVENISIQ